MLPFILAILVAIASAFGIFWPITYSRENLMYATQGIGQDIINLGVVVPLLLFLALAAKKGSRAANLCLGGPILYSLYSYIIYAFTLHFNELFLLYCATLGVSFFAFFTWLTAIKIQVSHVKLPEPAFLKSAAWLQIFLAILFTVLWLSQIIPAQLQGQIPKSITDSGLATNAVYILDLSIFIPLLFISSSKLIKKQILGIILTSALLGFAALMTAAIAAMILNMKIQGLETNLLVAVIMIFLCIIICTILYIFIVKATTFSQAILLIGVPGSGKSTFVKENFPINSYDIHSTDAIRAELFGDENNQGDWGKIESTLKLRVANSIAAKKIPIIDATHARQAHRITAIAWINALGAEVQGLYVATPLAICQERNQKRNRVVPDDVIKSMHESLSSNPPSIEEGFVKIKIIIP